MQLCTKSGRIECITIQLIQIYIYLFKRKIIAIIKNLCVNVSIFNIIYSYYFHYDIYSIRKLHTFLKNQIFLKSYVMYIITNVKQWISSQDD